MLIEIDVKVIMKKKLDKDMLVYWIFGVCNFGMVWEVIGVEFCVGVMLFCNVIFCEVLEGIEVSVVDLLVFMSVIDNDEFK